VKRRIVLLLLLLASIAAAECIPLGDQNGFADDKPSCFSQTFESVGYLQVWGDEADVLITDAVRVFDNHGDEGLDLLTTTDNAGDVVFKPRRIDAVSGYFESLQQASIKAAGDAGDTAEVIGLLKIAEDFPSNQGYEIVKNVEVFEVLEDGMKRSVGEIDGAVLKNGRLVHFTEIKKGVGKASDANNQIKKLRNAFSENLDNLRFSHGLSREAIGDVSKITDDTLGPSNAIGKGYSKLMDVSSSEIEVLTKIFGS